MGGFGRNPQRIPTQPEGDDIGKVVRGIGEQGEAVAENSRKDFDDDKGGGQPQRKSEAFCSLMGVCEAQTCRLRGEFQSCITPVIRFV
jgi:hypothetical protein